MRRTTRALLPVVALVALACSGGAGPGGLEPTSPPREGSGSGAGAPTSSPGRAAGPGDPAGVVIRLEPFLEGLSAPLYLTHARDGTGRVYVVEQEGTIRLAEADGTLLEEPFLDITDQVTAGGERGLLGLAFHPDYAGNGRFFVHYSDLEGDTVISEFAGEGQGGADSRSERVLLRYDQPFANHNGGQIGFGPDGFLYIGLGDGGSGGDPFGNGQSVDTLLGKILRVDVDGAQPYGIPPDNPFAPGGDGLPEIFDWGLRNPWRFSFDRATGDLFIGDVGQGAWEEIDLHPAGAPGGLNFGWNLMEGDHCFVETPCDQPELVGPVAEYSHDLGCTVIGGYVYRGEDQPALQGIYLFADYCSGLVFGISAQRAAAGPTTPVELLATDMAVSSFGEDEAGELYVTDLSGGTVHRVTASARP
jgi:glucose/arabinose dehydrogenase